MRILGLFLSLYVVGCTTPYIRAHQCVQFCEQLDKEFADFEEDREGTMKHCYCKDPRTGRTSNTSIK